MVASHSAFASTEASACLKVRWLRMDTYRKLDSNGSRAASSAASCLHHSDKYAAHGVCSGRVCLSCCLLNLCIPVFIVAEHRTWQMQAGLAPVTIGEVKMCK